MKVTELSIPGLCLVEPQVFGDARGFFLEIHQDERYRSFGVGASGFVQDNLSKSRRGVLRGMHLQNPNPQGKLVSVLEGEVWDVVLDTRVGSPTFGKWEAVTLSAENHRQLWIPEGLAHGFLVLSEAALFFYKCTRVYSPSTEVTVLWNDPAVGIAWPLDGLVPQLSAKDQQGVPLAQLAPERLCAYAPAGGAS
jgi:dTDP-4-dehydrorhamnose 3,5-epimerase